MAQVPAQDEYLAIEGPPTPYVVDTDVGAYTMGEPPSTEAAVNALHVQKYGEIAWTAHRLRQPPPCWPLD